MAMHDLAQTVARFTGAEPVRPIVIQSWQRSLEAGIDRDAPPSFRRVAADELERRQAENRSLLQVAIPHLRWLSQWFQQRPHVAYLVDRDGIVLHAEGDPDAVERYGLSPGYDWSESVMGTNGAGTALASGVPVAVIGCDHWSTAWKDATCLGAPILGRDRRPVGAIDISMDVQEGDADRLVVAAHVAYTISQELARREAEGALARAEAAESTLRVSAHWLQTIIDSTPAIVYVVDNDARFRLINRHFAERFSLEAEAVVGRSVFDYFPRNVAEQFLANNRRVLEANAVCEFEEIVPVGEKAHTYISVKAPLCDDAGVPYAVCGVSTDITERKRLMSALEVAQRQKDTVVATVAHELRQPLSAIQAALSVMKIRISREKGERARAVVERQVDQLARLVEDLLDAARIAQGKVTLRRERTALNSIIDAAVSVVQPLVRKRDQTLDVAMPSEPLWLDADPARLQQVFSNLLTNATKFTGVGGRISVSAEAAGTTVTARVRDTGRGIGAETLPGIFDLFSQATPDAQGLGIGLAVVRGLVERHGGTVEARSDGPGTGSEFVVRLPRAAVTSDAT